MLFIQYYVDTDSSATSKKLADYPNVPIHIEGGYVNGYFDLSRHTDEDWRDMTQNMMKHYSVQVLGERVMFHMELANVLKACPNTITDAIKWWDECVKWQHELMGADKYYDRWNDLIMAKDGYEGMFMYATETYTYYEHYTLPDILPWEKVYADPGQMWGPAHEIGHVNQNAINVVSCTEATNNLFANAQIFRTGKTTTRGNGLSVCREDFSNKLPFPLRGSDIIAKSRMFFQLYLYFHVAGKDTTFWPRVFEALRKNPLDKGPKDRNWTSLTQAKDDQLRFAEVCCEVAQMDLSEFFEAWGMFEPMTDAGVGDYENFIVNLTREEAEASRARMQRYAKKGGHLIFIEDRIKPSPRTDGVAGNRLDFNDEFAIGKMGNTGQWSDYIDESVKAEGYYFARSQNSISIKKTADANGALGFKLYHANTGELLDFNNDYKLTVPVAHANAPLKVVATQADGSNVELKNVADSDDEAMQLEALNATLSTVSALTKRKTTSGKEIGYFYTSALTEITALYNEANAAAKNADQSKHTYKEWIALLEAEVAKLKSNPNARAYLKELDVYTLTNFSGNRDMQLCYDKYGVKANTARETAATLPEKRWLVESTGVAHHYYIKNENGFYISDMEINLGTACNGFDQSEAMEFVVSYLDDGALYFTTESADGEQMYMTLDITDNTIVGNRELLETAKWSVRRVEQNNTGIVEVESENGKNGNIYDLQGRKVDTPSKGIYIIDGKKVIIR
jgi:hypothetical protein